MQKLILPFDRQMMLCGYKNPRYRQHWGYEHYGVDISTIQGEASDNHTIYASGEGMVVAVGKDNSLGWGIAVLYPDVYNHKTGKTQDLVARYMHMAEVFVEKGQKVDVSTPLAPEGKEGTGDYHLHLEFDTDTRYPTYSPQVSAGHTFWMKGLDSSVNPSYVLHIAKGRALVKPTYNLAWLNEEDFSIPQTETDTELERLRKAVTEYEAERATVYNLAKQIMDMLS